MGPFAESMALAEAARAAEGRGYDSIWVGDHLVLPRPQAPPSPLAPDHPIIEPIAALAYLAGVTDSILLGTGIVILPQRHPVVLAKQGFGGRQPLGRPTAPSGWAPGIWSPS